MATKIEHKEVVLNNKSRKGKYLYVKGDNLPGRHYKIQNDSDINLILQHYKLRYIEERATTNQPIKKSRPSQRAIKIDQKRIAISTLLKKGQSSSTLHSLRTASPLKMHQAKKLALTGIFSGTPKQLDALAKRDNFKKVKTRAEIVLEGWDKQGNRLFRASKLNTTLEDARKDLNSMKELSKSDALQNAKNAHYVKEAFGKAKWGDFKLITFGQLHKISAKLTMVKA